ncbi:hypothetical protein LUR56_39890 [Streptomyces sp. MT29]|nr:hypothetical protein [Streptomyces sp. MT29]
MSGSLIGVWIGRRTVRDQAQVEHEQWLRGQRQEAFVNFLASWDEALKKLSGRVLEDDVLEELEHTGEWEQASNALGELLHDEVLPPVIKAGERLTMLGPPPVVQAATVMLQAAEDVAVGIATQFVEPQRGATRYDAYWAALTASAAPRAKFVTETTKVLQTAPDTKRA